MKETSVQTLKDLLKDPKKVVIVGHKNPDGDAVGSCLGLWHFLMKRGHEAEVILPNDYPHFLKWLPGNDSVLIYEHETKKAHEKINDADIIFTLDFNALNRTGGMETALKEATADFVMIDHHQQPDDYAIVTYSDTQMSSTAEMVFHCIEALEGVREVNQAIATNLYAGIMTDTGSFRFPATSARTHRVVAALIDAGANNSEIHQNIFDTNSPDRMKLLGIALNNMVLLPEYNAAYITLSQTQLDDNNFKKGDTEGFVNYPLSIEGVLFSTIFIENRQESITKISFRSKGSFSVNDFARNHFNGGGHINAAGGRSEQSLENTVKDFISILPNYKDALHHDA